jgi:hypothetical protein
LAIVDRDDTDDANEYIHPLSNGDIQSIVMTDPRIGPRSRDSGALRASALVSRVSVALKLESHASGMSRPYRYSVLASCD